MIIQDRTEELKEGLKESYKKKITEIISNAQSLGNTDADSFLSQFQQEIDEYSKQKIGELRAEFQQKVAGARLAMDQEIAKHKAALVQEMNEHLVLEASKLPKKEKEKLTKKMHKRILIKIREQGFKTKDFKIKVWRGAKIGGTTPSLKELAVIAESDQVIITDSTADLLQDHYNDIIKIVSRHIEDNLD